jgi:hypothetical protein
MIYVNANLPDGMTSGLDAEAYMSPISSPFRVDVMPPKARSTQKPGR